MLKQVCQNAWHMPVACNQMPGIYRLYAAGCRRNGRFGPRFSRPYSRPIKERPAILPGSWPAPHISRIYSAHTSGIVRRPGKHGEWQRGVTVVCDVCGVVCLCVWLGPVVCGWVGVGVVAVLSVVWCAGLNMAAESDSDSEIAVTALPVISRK